MIKYMDYEDDFFKAYEKDRRKIIVYGAGNGLKNYFEQIPDISYICDRNAREIKNFRGIKVCEPEILQDEREPIYVIVSIQDGIVYEEVCEELLKYEIEATVVHLFNNLAFGYNYWNTAKSYQKKKNTDRLKVNIVCTEESWIFRKFADRMYEWVSKYDVDVTISSDTREDVDINHHIPYVSFKTYSNDTVMITHVDTSKKMAMLKRQLETAGMGICMSKDTMNQLVMSGVPREKLCYINPAQDNVIKPHKYVIGITNKCHDDKDLRKRKEAILEVIDGIDSSYFRFVIMGAGWNEIVLKMKDRGFEVIYYPDFMYDRYNELMQEIDYFLYMGFDEGAMGYLDALAAGAGTIVTPQGYHLDVDCPIDYPCTTVKQFREAFLDLQKKRKLRIKAVSDWTWDNYALKHLEVWNYLLKRKELKDIYKNQLCYSDGIHSALIEDNRI